jgi:hypothetical protein
MGLNEAQTSKVAFERVRAHLTHDVGTLFKLIGTGHNYAFQPDEAPNWALMRLMFPVAESLGDLIYRDSKPVKNLESILGNEFEAVRAGYKGMTAILTHLFRHSLIHTDEPRILISQGKKIAWKASSVHPTKHLIKEYPARDVCLIWFDTRGFYYDLLTVCDKQIEQQHSDQVRDRYNGWLTLELDAEPKKNKSAIGEISKLFQAKGGTRGTA